MPLDDRHRFKVTQAKQPARGTSSIAFGPRHLRPRRAAVCVWGVVRVCALVGCLGLVGLAAAAEPAAAELVLESALVRPIDEVDVAAQEAGLLTAIAIREGQRVEPGDLLAQIDDFDAQLAAAQAQQELLIATRKAESDVPLRSARKSRDVAGAEWQRGRESVEKYKKSLSQTELDRLQFESERAELDVQQAELDQELAGLESRLREIELEFAQRRVERRRMRSPLAGVVVEVRHRAGEWVEPGTTVVRLLRNDRLRVEAFLDADRATGALLASPASFTLNSSAGSSQPFLGEITFVSPEIDPINGQVRIWAEVANPDGSLRTGQQGTLKIQLGPRK